MIAQADSMQLAFKLVNCVTVKARCLVDTGGMRSSGLCGEQRGCDHSSRDRQMRDQ